MCRIARAVAIGIPHHVTQRGNGQRNVFFSARDREVYLDTFFRYAERYSVRVRGYCLMENHVHFVVVPEREESLAQAFGRTHCDYARYSNVSRSSSGHLWQSRFYSCAMDDVHAWRALAYVERNPVRAHIVGAAERYPWSSAAAHCLDDDMGGRLDFKLWREDFTGPRWHQVLRTSIADEAWQQRFHDATLRGTPLGAEPFVEQVGQELGRELKVRPRGRPAVRPLLAALA